MNHRLGQDCRRRGAVARHVISLRGDFLGELGAKVLIRVLQLNFARDGDTVVRDGGSAPLLVDDDVATAWPQRHLYGVRETVDAALKRAPGVLVELQNFRHEKPQTTVGQCFCLGVSALCFCANFPAPVFLHWSEFRCGRRSRCGECCPVATRHCGDSYAAALFASWFRVLRSGFHGQVQVGPHGRATRPESKRHDRERLYRTCNRPGRRIRNRRQRAEAPWRPDRVRGGSGLLVDGGEHVAGREH